MMEYYSEARKWQNSSGGTQDKHREQSGSFCRDKDKSNVSSGSLKASSSSNQENNKSTSYLPASAKLHNFSHYGKEIYKNCF